MEQPRPAKRPRAEHDGQDDPGRDRKKETDSQPDGDSAQPQQPHVHSTGVREEDMPPVFLAWLSENRVDPRVYTLNTKLPRYVRRNPRLQQPSAADISAQLGGAELCPVRWLPRGVHGWYALDCNVKIARCEAYRKGHIYGMDASSAAAVIALAPQIGDRVLDLCCAPATKTCMLADALSMASRSAAKSGASASMSKIHRSLQCQTLKRDLRTHEISPSVHTALVGGGTDGAARPDSDPWVTPITAVDVSSERLKVARNIMGKYGIAVIECTGNKHGHNRGGRSRPTGQQAVANGADVAVRLFCEDGTHFNEPPAVAPAPLVADVDVEDHVDDGRTAPAAVAATSKSTDNALPDNSPPLCDSAPPPGPLYNRILVDAECTHDGSLKHIAKFANQWGWSTFERRVPWLAPEKIAEVTGLQRALLWNGFRLLEPCRTPPSHVHGAGTGMRSSAVASSLVYSTCSLSRSQNEDVVSWLLSIAPTARVVPIDQDECSIRLYGKLGGGNIDDNDAEARASHFCIAAVFLKRNGTISDQECVRICVHAQKHGLPENRASCRTLCVSTLSLPTRAGSS